MTERIGIVGLGLIGGSLGLALRRAGREVVASTRNPAAIAGARAAGIEIFDSPEAVAAAVDVCVVATSLPVVLDSLSALDAAGGNCTLTDVASVKAPIHERTQTFLDPGRFVGGHPMAGTQHIGWEAADADLFIGRKWALCIDGTTLLPRWAATARMAFAAGATVVAVAPDEHDRAVAAVSHLSYVLAALGAATASSGHEEDQLRWILAGGSFNDVTRVAGGNAQLGREMAWANRTELAPFLREAASKLSELSEQVDSNPEAVAKFFADGHHARSRFETTTGSWSEAVPRMYGLGDLLAAGRRGALITEVGEIDAVGERLAVRVVEPPAIDSEVTHGI